MRYAGKCGACGDEFEAEEVAGAAYLVHAARDEFWARHVHSDESVADTEVVAEDEDAAEGGEPESRARRGVGFVLARYAEGSA